MDNNSAPQKKKRFLRVVWGFIRDFITISLAFAFTDYITERHKISSSIYEFLIYFGFLIVVTIFIYFVVKLIKKTKNKGSK